MAPAPQFRSFQLALIQLGQIGSNKEKNLDHARNMIMKAASGNEGRHPKPDLIVLPVRPPDASLNLIMTF